MPVEPADAPPPTRTAKRGKIAQYLGRAEVAQYLGLASVASLSRLKLPPPDAMIGPHRGWLPSTIDTWNETRPGRGRWGPR